MVLPIEDKNLNVLHILPGQSRQEKLNVKTESVYRTQMAAHTDGCAHRRWADSMLCSRWSFRQKPRVRSKNRHRVCFLPQPQPLLSLCLSFPSSFSLSSSPLPIFVPSPPSYFPHLSLLSLFFLPSVFYFSFFLLSTHKTKTILFCALRNDIFVAQGS